MWLPKSSPQRSRYLGGRYVFGGPVKMQVMTYYRRIAVSITLLLVARSEWGAPAFLIQTLTFALIANPTAPIRRLSSFKIVSKLLPSVA